jgi:hypothetical protein
MLDGEKPKSKRQSTMRLRIGAPLLIDSTRRISQILGIDLTRGRMSMQSEKAAGTAPLVGNAASSSRTSDGALSFGIGFPTAQEFPLPPPRRPAQLDLASVNSSQRVTVSLRRGRAPTLILRLSDNNLPSPSVIMKRTQTQDDRDDRTVLDDRMSTFTYTGSENIRGPHDTVMEVPLLESEAQAFAQSSPTSIYSPGKSLIENFRTQAFPAGVSSSSSRRGLPANPHARPQSIIQPPPPMAVREPRVSFLQRTDPVYSQRSSPEVPPLDTALTAVAAKAPRRVLSKRKPAPAERASMYLDRANFISPVTPADGVPSLPIPDSAGHRPRGFGSPDSLISTDWMPAVPRAGRPITADVDPGRARRIAATMVDPARAHSLRRPRAQSDEGKRMSSLAGSPADRTLGRDSTLNIDWIADPNMLAEDAEAGAGASQDVDRRHHARMSSQVLRAPSTVLRASAARTAAVTRHASAASAASRAVSREASVSSQSIGTVRKISVGSAPMRTTPLPTPAVETRASVNVEQLVSSGLDSDTLADDEDESEDMRRRTLASQSSSGYESASLRHAVVHRVQGSVMSDAESAVSGSTWTPQHGRGISLNTSELAQRYGEAF